MSISSASQEVRRGILEVTADSSSPCARGCRSRHEAGREPRLRAPELVRVQEVELRNEELREPSDEVAAVSLLRLRR